MTHLLRVGIVLAALTSSTTLVAAPSAGDFAFSAINADEDGFALTTLVNLSAGEEFFFTDNEWNALPVGNGGGFSSGEGVLSWTLDADLTAGSVVRFASVNSTADIWVSEGSLVRSGSFSLATTNDSVTLYRDAAGVLTPLAAIGFGASFEDELQGAGLDGAYLAFGGRVDFAEYVGARSGEATFDAYRASLTDATQWIVRESTIEANTVPYLGSFAVTAPVPEPETYAMMLAGLAMVGSVARRRRVS